MTCSRRAFLLRTVTGAGAAAAAPALSGCALQIDPAPVADVGPVVSGKLSVPVGRFPALAQDGGALTVRADGLVSPLLVVHPGGTEYHVTASICTHAGCPLGFADGQIQCPCHGSRFDLQGHVTNPPARQGLRIYPASYDATSDDLIIDLTAGDLPAVVNGQVVLTLADFSQLAKAGGFLVGTPTGWSNPILVVALTGGAYAALDATCTHLGCIVGYSATANQVQCPCHGSIFNTNGSVVQGPATKPLGTYVATSDGTAVTVVLA